MTTKDLAEQVYFISRHAELSTDGIAAVESLLTAARDETVIDALKRSRELTQELIDRERIKAKTEERNYWQEFLKLNKLNFKEGQKEAYDDAARIADSLDAQTMQSLAFGNLRPAEIIVNQIRRRKEEVLKQ